MYLDEIEIDVAEGETTELLMILIFIELSQWSNNAFCVGNALTFMLRFVFPDT